MSACSAISDWFKPEEVIITKYIERDIPIQGRPKPVNLYDVRFEVVTRENLEEFLIENEKTYGGAVFYAISVPDYENLSLNVAELKRYLQQQNAIILYYEENISGKKDGTE